MNKPLSQQYEEMGLQWTDLDAAATLLEDTKSSFLSQKMQTYIDVGFAVNRAEAAVKASPEWSAYIYNMVETRKKANVCRVKMDTIKMRISEQMSEEANNRAASKM